MRKVLGATTSGWASLAVEKDGGAQHESPTASAMAGAQQASSAGLAVCAEQGVPAISWAGFAEQQVDVVDSGEGPAKCGLSSITGLWSFDALAGEVAQVEVLLQQLVRSSSMSLDMGVIRFLRSLNTLHLLQGQADKMSVREAKRGMG